MEAMTPIPPERVEIDGVNILEYLDLMKEKGLSWPHADAQIRYILSDYSALKAENEALVKRCEELFYNVTEGEWLAKVESYTKLEAENERLREDNNYFHAGFDSVREDYEEQKARAEKADDKLAEVTKLWSTAERDATHLYARMMKAEEQLAKQAPLVNALLRIANEAFPLEVTEKCMRSVARAALALREEKK
jgi:predicted nuclease with TOPRIM domain